MGCLNNVIELNKSNAKDYIDLFLRKKGNNSDNTRLTYETAILQFFKALYNIDSLEFVTDEMISGLTSVKCQNYFQEMVDSEKYAMSSIKNKLIAVRSLFQNIVDDRVTDVKGNLLLDYNPLKTYDIKSEGQSYGLLTHDEMIKILQLVKEDGDTQLYLYYALMYKCALRKEECRNIKLQDFYIKDGIARVKVLCKGNKLEDCEACNELYELAKSIAKEDGTLFTYAQNYAFNNCRECAGALYFGKFFQCGKPLIAKKLNETFGTNFEIKDSDYLDIFKAHSIDDFNKFRSRSKHFCGYCKDKIRPIKQNTFEWTKKHKDLKSEFIESKTV